MHYYIDGYNLFFRFNRNEGDFSKQRQQMIDELNMRIQFLKIEATIVFDSHYQPSEGSRAFFQNVEIIFTDEGETADDRILAEINSIDKPQHVTVVTSDKKLAWFARRCDAKTESVEVFVAWLYKRYENKQRQKVAKVKPAVKQRKITSKESVPQPTTKPEECYDYYLTTFQTRLEELEQEPKPHRAHAGKRQPRLKSKKPPIGMSDAARWHHIFEQKLKSGDDGMEEI